jgi:hypothetical protein
MILVLVASLAPGVVAVALDGAVGLSWGVLIGFSLLFLSFYVFLFPLRFLL